MNWNRRAATAAALALLVLTNAVALGGAAWNRSGEPDSRLRLSERELFVPWSGWPSTTDENSGLSLTLNWRCIPASTLHGRSATWYDNNSPAWLDARKMTELGFDMGRARVAPGIHRPHEVREVWLVLELDGPAYRRSQALAAAAAASAASSPQASVRPEASVDASRLFAVDAGLDRAALRARYGDRAMYAIVRAQVGMLRDTEVVVEAGRIESLSIDEIEVPLSLRPVFADIRRGQGAAGERGRFDATVAFGRRAEPWLAEAHATRRAPSAR